MRNALVLAGAAAFVACPTPGAAQSSEGDIDRPAPAFGRARCDAGRAQHLVGRQATAELGRELLKLTRARQLRWVPPGTAVTMDFRPDRLTVSYDRAMKIERITCG